MVHGPIPNRPRYQAGHAGGPLAVPPRRPALLPDGVVPTDESVYAAIHDYTLHHRQPVPQGCQMDSVKLFVGNLPKCFSEEMLRPVFEHFGQVMEVCVTRDRHTRESKGSAFLWYSSLPEAASAIRELHAQCHLPDGASGISSRALTVRPATFSRGRPQEPHEVLAGPLLFNAHGMPYPGLESGLARGGAGPAYGGGHDGAHAQDFRPSETQDFRPSELQRYSAGSAGAYGGVQARTHLGSPRPRCDYAPLGRGARGPGLSSSTCPSYAPPALSSATHLYASAPHAGGWPSTQRQGGPQQAPSSADDPSRGPPPGLHSSLQQHLDFQGNGLASSAAALYTWASQGSPGEAGSPTSRHGVGPSMTGSLARNSRRLSSLPCPTQLHKHFESLHTGASTEAAPQLNVSLSAAANYGGADAAAWPPSTAAATAVLCPQRTASWVHSSLEAISSASAELLLNDAGGRSDAQLTPETVKDLLKRLSIPAECTATPEAEAATLRLLLHLSGQLIPPARGPA